MLITLTGIDGSGKTTAARNLAGWYHQEGGKALLLKNCAGRRFMTVWSRRLGINLNPRVADTAETVVRTINVLVSHARARAFDGLVVMDRDLHCQLALREARGLPRGTVLPWLNKVLPTPDAVIHLYVSPPRAHDRILTRATDEETVADLKNLLEGYRRLPEYADWTVVDAEASPGEVLQRVRQATFETQLLKV